MKKGLLNILLIFCIACFFLSQEIELTSEKSLPSAVGYRVGKVQTKKVLRTS